MTITTVQWIDAGRTSVQVDGSLSVPADARNPDWREVQAWVAAGGVIAAPPTPPARAVSRAEAVDALLAQEALAPTAPQEVKDYVASRPPRQVAIEP